MSKNNPNGLLENRWLVSNSNTNNTWTINTIHKYSEIIQLISLILVKPLLNHVLSKTISYFQKLKNLK